MDDLPNIILSYQRYLIKTPIPSLPYIDDNNTLVLECYIFVSHTWFVNIKDD